MQCSAVQCSEYYWEVQHNACTGVTAGGVVTLHYRTVHCDVVLRVMCSVVWCIVIKPNKVECYFIFYSAVQAAVKYSTIQIQVLLVIVVQKYLKGDM